MRISDWSSDVCSSDLFSRRIVRFQDGTRLRGHDERPAESLGDAIGGDVVVGRPDATGGEDIVEVPPHFVQRVDDGRLDVGDDPRLGQSDAEPVQRSEEHTSELQSLMRISYAVFCLKKKK